MMSADDLVFMAKVAEKAGRFDDMAQFLTQLLDLKSPHLSTEDCSLLTVSFKHLISSKRKAIRVITGILTDQHLDKARRDLIQYKHKLEQSYISESYKVISLV